MVELIRELNRMLGIEMKLSTVFHLQISEQIEHMNQELEQYLQFFVDYRQRDQPEWLVIVEFAVISINTNLAQHRKLLDYIVITLLEYSNVLDTFPSI